MKKPTLKEKVAKYEEYLHLICTMVVAGDNEGIRTLVSNADDWSYAHRAGNGELSEKQQQELINKRFHKLCEIESK